MNALLALVTVSASLHITVWPQGADGTARSWTLRCNPSGGTLPQRATACMRLAKLAHPFAPVPTGVACSDIYGGPQTAFVTGTFRGSSIRAQFNRRNGCEVERWNRVRFLFPVSLGASQ